LLNKKRSIKITTNILTALLALFVVSIIFIRFSPSYNIFMVRSGSMSPAIEAGDIIFTGTYAQLNAIAASYDIDYALAANGTTNITMKWE